MATRLLSAVWRVNKVLPILVLLLLTANIIVLMLLRFTVAPNVRALEGRLAESRQRAERLADPARVTAALYRQAEADIDQYRAAIPGKEEFTAFLGELFSHSAQAGLTIDRISYTPSEDAGTGLLHYALAFVVQGEYQQLKRFIHALEQSPRIIAIEGISLTGGGGEAVRGGKVSLSIRLTTYFRTDQQ